MYISAVVNSNTVTVELPMKDTLEPENGFLYDGFHYLEVILHA